MSSSKFQALIHSKCPKCHIGKVFEGYTYSVSKQKMNEFCPHCALKFEVEPGYFYAAMYVSYAFSVAEVITFALITYLITQSESPWVYLAAISLAILAFAPFNFRYSRLVLLHYLTPKVNYDPRFERELAAKSKTH